MVKCMQNPSGSFVLHRRYGKNVVYRQKAYKPQDLAKRGDCDVGHRY